MDLMMILLLIAGIVGLVLFYLFLLGALDSGPGIRGQSRTGQYYFYAVSKSTAETDC